MAEKYNHWADPGTGINPFVPIREKQRPNIFVKMLRALVGTPLAVARLALALVLLLLVALTELCAYCLVIGHLRRLCARTFDPIFARALLWAFGFWWVREDGADLTVTAQCEQPGVTGGVDRVRDGVEQGDIAAMAGNRIAGPLVSFDPDHGR